MKKRLAIIPARGGSKRIPRKNVRDFCGKPIIAYSIETALSSGLFEEVMVSTDDFEISKVAGKYGAKIPFLRSVETANDHAGLIEVVHEVIQSYKNIGIEFEQLCCILPTAPLILKSDLVESLSVLNEGNYDTVFPVVAFSYPIQRALKRTEHHITMVWPENYSARSQDLPVTFHDCGQFYWLNYSPEFHQNRLFTENSSSIILPETRVQDLDTEEDWKICELKFSLAQSISQKNVVVS